MMLGNMSIPTKPYIVVSVLDHGVNLPRTSISNPAYLNLVFSYYTYAMMYAFWSADFWSADYYDSTHNCSHVDVHTLHGNDNNHY